MEKQFNEFENFPGKLSLEEMRNIMGSACHSSGSCGWHVGGHYECGLSQGCAQEHVAEYGGQWCCDSCPPGC